MLEPYSFLKQTVQSGVSQDKCAAAAAGERQSQFSTCILGLVDSAH